MNAQGQNRRRKWGALVLGICVLFALVAILYVRAYHNFWGNVPQLKRNFNAELNAPIAKIPVDQRAWPHYRQALVKLKPGLDRWKDDDFDADAPARPEIEAFLTTHQDALAELRAASNLPHLGYLYSDAMHTEDKVLDAATADGQADVVLPNENPRLMDVLLVPQGYLKKAVNLLLADAKLAISSRDAVRVMADVIAVFSIARHMSESGGLASLSWPCNSRASTVLGESLEQGADFFTDEQLAEIDRCLRDFPAEGLALDLTFERTVMADLEQRWFTDDGKGDGYLYPERDGEVYLDGFTKAALPLAQNDWKRGTVFRKEFRQKVKKLFDSAEKEFAQPVWTIRKLSFASQLKRLNEETRWSVVMLFFPDLAHFYFDRHRIGMQVDAIRVALALARYRQRHGDWPQTLEMLVGEFLDAIPLDRFDGKPLRYQLQDGKPSIYSVCLDRNDDRGHPVSLEVSHDLTTLWNESGQAGAELITGDLILWPELKTQPLADEPIPPDEQRAPDQPIAQED